MKKFPMKRDFPVDRIRRYLEPGPIVLVSSRWKDRTNVMTMGWHLVMEFSPSLVGCIISEGNYTFGLVRSSRECVINLPTADMVDTVVKVGNTTGAEIDKFEAFGLTPGRAVEVEAPLIRECHANFECRLRDDGLVEKYNFFIFEVLKAHVAPKPEYPDTLHYTGRGIFVTSGGVVDRRSLFRKDMLDH